MQSDLNRPPLVIIADSSALFALVDMADATHKFVASVHPLIPDDARVIIPAEIFSETVNTLWKKIQRSVAVAFAEKLLTSSGFLLTESDDEIRRTGINMWKNLRSKNISFTDCLVMAHADRWKTKWVFGLDEAFAKNGYLRLGVDGYPES